VEEEEEGGVGKKEMLERGIMIHRFKKSNWLVLLHLLQRGRGGRGRGRIHLRRREVEMIRGSSCYRVGRDRMEMERARGKRWIKGTKYLY